MSMSEVTTWVTDIGQLGPIYPMAGTEFTLYVIGMVFWIGFHILQGRIEAKELAEEERSLAESGRLAQALEERDH